MIRQAGKQEVQALLDRLRAVAVADASYTPATLIDLLVSAGVDVVKVTSSRCSIITGGRRVRLSYVDLAEAIGGRVAGELDPQPPARAWTTYAVRDPDTREVVYVGQTSDFERRQRAHQRVGLKRPGFGAQNIKTWMWDTISAGKTPLFEALELCDTELSSLASETRWVEEFTRRGYKLLNRWWEHRSIVKASVSDSASG